MQSTQKSYERPARVQRAERRLVERPVPLLLVPVLNGRRESNRIDGTLGLAGRNGIAQL